MVHFYGLEYRAHTVRRIRVAFPHNGRGAILLDPQLDQQGRHPLTSPPTIVMHERGAKVPGCSV